MRLRICLLLILFTSTMSATAGADWSGGRLEVLDSTGVNSLPGVSSDYKVQIAGDIATVVLTQVFRNDLGRPVNARYLFPLSKDAAVHAMTMEVGDEIVRAVIKPKAQAQETFERAKKTGQSAVLLEQHRPNMFTQRVANLAPDAPISVVLKYVQPLTRIDSEYELVLPLVVGPRYRSLSTDRASALAASAPRVRLPGRWTVNALPDPTPVIAADVPEDLTGRVTISVNLDGLLPVRSVFSSTHPIVTRVAGENARAVTLQESAIIANRDFILRYSLAGEDPQAGFASHKDARGGYFSLLIEPPIDVKPDQITPREMVFVLDCSGSMSGPPLEASKMFMRKALRALRPTDSFRIIRFSENATEFSRTPLMATPANVNAGLRYVERLNSTGGTEMTTGIIQALSVAPLPGTLRMVTFLTDGYIGHEAEVISLIERQIGGARLFALGVGAAPNRYLLSEMGHAGRGFVRYVDPESNADTVTTLLANRLDSPVLTDISIDWGTLDVVDVFPRKIPDLFAGQSVRVQGRFEGTGQHHFTVNGRVAGQAANLDVVARVDGSEPREAVPLMWARSAIADGMRTYTTASTKGNETESIEREVTNLGLLFGLVTRWTSFVAVSERRYNNDTENTPDLDIPRHQVAGTRTPAAQFMGHGAPEPGQILTIVVLMGLLLWIFGFDRGRWNTLFARRWCFDLNVNADARLLRKADVEASQYREPGSVRSALSQRGKP